MKTDSDNKSKKWFTTLLSGIGFLLLISIWFATPYLASVTKTRTFYKEVKFESPGVVGDSFGATNALFSGVAIILLFFTYRAQKEELHLTKIELAKTANSQSKIAKLSALTSKLDALSILIPLQEAKVKSQLVSPDKTIISEIYCIEALKHIPKSDHYKEKKENLEILLRLYESLNSTFLEINSLQDINPAPNNPQQT